MFLTPRSAGRPALPAPIAGRPCNSPAGLQHAIIPRRSISAVSSRATRGSGRRTRIRSEAWRGEGCRASLRPTASRFPALILERPVLPGLRRIQAPPCGELIGPCYHSWCGRWESNPHSLRNGILNPARLPIPPRPRTCHEALSRAQLRFTHSFDASRPNRQK